MLFDPQADPSSAYASVGASVAQSGVLTGASNGAPGPFAHLAPLSPSVAPNRAPALFTPTVTSAPTIRSGSPAVVTRFLPAVTPAPVTTTTATIVLLSLRISL